MEATVPQLNRTVKPAARSCIQELAELCSFRPVPHGERSGRRWPRSRGLVGSCVMGLLCAVLDDLYDRRVQARLLNPGKEDDS